MMRSLAETSESQNMFRQNRVHKTRITRSKQVSENIVANYVTRQTKQNSLVFPENKSSTSSSSRHPNIKNALAMHFKSAKN